MYNRRLHNFKTTSPITIEKDIPIYPNSVMELNPLEEVSSALFNVRTIDESIDQSIRDFYTYNLVNKGWNVYLSSNDVNLILARKDSREIAIRNVGSGTYSINKYTSNFFDFNLPFVIF